MSNSNQDGRIGLYALVWLWSTLGFVIWLLTGSIDVAFYWLGLITLIGVSLTLIWCVIWFVNDVYKSFTPSGYFGSRLAARRERNVARKLNAAAQRRERDERRHLVGCDL